MPITIDDKPLEDALLLVGAGQPIPTRSKAGIATGLLWAAVRDFDPQLVPDGVLPALPAVAAQKNGSPVRVDPANQPNPAPQSDSDIDSATAPTIAEPSSSSA